MTITADEAINLIVEKKKKDEERFVKRFAEEPGLEVLKGRFGPYIAYKKKNYRLPKSVENPQELTLAQCLEIVKEADSKPATEKKRSPRRKA